MYININFLVEIIITAIYAWYMVHQVKSLNKALELGYIKDLSEAYNLYIAYNGYDEKAKELEDKVKEIIERIRG